LIIGECALSDHWSHYNEGYTAANGHLVCIGNPANNFEIYDIKFLTFVFFENVMTILPYLPSELN